MKKLKDIYWMDEDDLLSRAIDLIHVKVYTEELESDSPYGEKDWSARIEYIFDHLMRVYIHDSEDVMTVFQYLLEAAREDTLTIVYTEWAQAYIVMAGTPEEILDHLFCEMPDLKLRVLVEVW